MDCLLGYRKQVSMIRVVSADKRRIAMGNGSGADLDAIYGLLRKQLGDDIVRPCESD